MFDQPKKMQSQQTPTLDDSIVETFTSTSRVVLIKRKYLQQFEGEN